MLFIRPEQPLRGQDRTRVIDSQYATADLELAEVQRFGFGVLALPLVQICQEPPAWSV